jgi:hypothetical protein
MTSGLGLSFLLLMELVMLFLCCLMLTSSICLVSVVLLWLLLLVYVWFSEYFVVLICFSLCSCFRVFLGYFL